MRFTEANIVLLGGFNPHIIEPGWLRREHVVEDTQDAIQAAMVVGGDDSGRMHFSLGGYQWQVSGERLLVAVKNGAISYLSPVTACQRLLEKLPHTPIRALGYNFTFRCEREKWPHPAPSVPGIERFADELGTLESSSTTLLLKRKDEVRIRLTLNVGQDSVSLSANVHRNVEGLRMAITHMISYQVDCEWIKRVVAGMSKQEIET